VTDDGEGWATGVISRVDSTPEDVLGVKAVAAAATTGEQVSQVAQLELCEALLARFLRLFEVYVAPQHFVSPEGLTKDQHVEKLLTTQRMALRLLIPRNGSLLGALKILIESLSRLVDVKHRMLGLEKTRTADTISPADTDSHLSSRALSSGELDGLSVAQLHSIRDAMELLERHTQSLNEPPRPPPPERIDDLLRGPEADGGTGTRP
jgi:hypothetical protein